MKISLFVRLAIIVSIVISVTDIIGFYHLFNDPNRLPLIPFVILLIFITILPIVISLWFWLVYKKR
jgi:hypothetical protein